MKWTEEYRINVHDTDLNGIVSASGILRYMQDTSNLHMAGEGPSYEAAALRITVVSALSAVRTLWQKPPPCGLSSI